MLPENSVIGRYEIARRVARGGMGTLYLAQDPVLARPVALKLFLGDLELPEARERFVREARAAAALNHPHIVTIYDYGEYSSQPYMVMEFIHGETLAAMIRRGADPPLETRLRWIEELCSAVEYAHAHGVIHRDLKPLNLMVDSYNRLKVLDFGIARMRGSLASHTTARIGTAGYMAPEQIRGGNIDHRSDLFSIGVVCYELITSVPPFAADVDVAVTHRILEEEPKPLQEVDPATDPELADFVWKALRKDPAARFQTAASMLTELAAIRRRLATADSGIQIPPVLPVMDTAATAAREGGDVSPAAVPDKRVKDRTAKIQASVVLARQLLDTGKLAAARTECESVLQLDSVQPEALELLRRIDVEVARAEAAVLLSRGHEELQRGAITKAVELLDRVRSLTPDNPEASRLDRALRIARAQHGVERRRGDRFQQALQAAEDALDRGTAEEALSHAREALEIDPNSTKALALEAQALRRIDEDTGPPPDEAITQLSSAKAPAAQSRSPSVPVVTRAKPADRPKSPSRFDVMRTNLSARWSKVPSRQRTAILSSTAAVVVLTAAGIVWAEWPHKKPPPPPPPAPVVVVINALPWAMVKEVRRDDGAAVTLPGNQYTPLRLQLPPGNYHVTLVGPDGTTERRIDYDVRPGAESRAPERFEVMTADNYFEPYLKGKQPAAPAVVR